MSILNTVKQFLTGQRTSSGWVNSTEISIVEREPSIPAVNDWEVTTGRVSHPQQERKVTYHNNEINGLCTGKIGELTGSAMIGLFEDMPAWLPSLLIRVTVQTDEGKLSASLRERNGTVVQIPVPGVLECNPELVRGRVWLRCESGQSPARNIRYEAVII